MEKNASITNVPSLAFRIISVRTIKHVSTISACWVVEAVETVNRKNLVLTTNAKIPANVKMSAVQMPFVAAKITELSALVRRDSKAILHLSRVASEFQVHVGLLVVVPTNTSAYPTYANANVKNKVIVPKENAVRMDCAQKYATETVIACLVSCALKVAVK